MERGTSYSLPVRKQHLVRLLREDPDLGLDASGFDALVHALGCVFHHAFFPSRERIQQAFALFDPEEERRFGPFSDEARRKAAEELAHELDHLLTRANYQRISFEQVERAMREASIFKIGITVRLEDFQEMVIYRRREIDCTEHVPVWFGLKRRHLVVKGFDRVCLFIHFKDARHFELRKRKNLPFVPGSLCLKLFRHIPQCDLETLFPNAEVRMRLADRLFLGVPALVGVAHFLFFKLGWGMLVVLFLAILFLLRLRDDEPDVKSLVTAGVTLGVFVAYLVRQWFRFKNRKIFFLKVLSENLYFRNLDNGPGVFFHLIHEAEDAEVNEALLAWVFLAAAGRPLTSDELRRHVEAWIAPRIRSAAHFEAGDALAKLERLGLVSTDGGARCATVPLDEALERLEELWRELVRHPGAPEPGPREEESRSRVHERGAERG